MLQNAPQAWSREQSNRLLFLWPPHTLPSLKSSTHTPFFFFFASRTQLPHLTFSIWPLPRGEIARVSKGGRHTSWILLSFNLHSPFSPWWCTRIGNKDIAQLRGFPRLLPRYCGYFCGTLRFWCITDMDIGFTVFVWCLDTSTDKNSNSSAPFNRKSPVTRWRHTSLSVTLPLQHSNNFYVCNKVLFVYFNLISHG